MSLSHALLGLLAVAPASGYELTKEFEQEIGRYAWQAGHTSIYPELGKLAARGLVHVTHEGARGAKTYDVTDEGREELRSWLLQPPNPTATVRNEQVLRMFLLSALEPADQRLMLTRIAEHTGRAATELRAVVATETPGGGPRAGFGRLAGEFGIRQYEAVHEWALWALDHIAEDGQA
ncbi:MULTISPECIES: PadR family transcriptional regulator [unclassified Pseudonocardia]|jgi:DNA-binding PadR family transcriptional regulator|uniref:PadR family transcriptional regulator n=1 Tax=unclassified Pseudonocardia TaxID=2619320 RepID=UPI00096254A7|nr:MULTISPECIES: PadR family transcriptional regulator [unclassified Pseudonocardia]MBN9100069.1 PadR family transcriptional regulator [Pseudonocardia sp.]OJY39665.1 MAG: PadR family transcriptional regulator [Pseudonocardia sp. 73-21]